MLEIPFLYHLRKWVTDMDIANVASQANLGRLRGEHTERKLAQLRRRIVEEQIGEDLNRN